MKNQNPFMPGDRVVCIISGSGTWQNPEGTPMPQPKKGDVFLVESIYEYDYLIFVEIPAKSYHYRHFAPIQDATEMEFEETEFAHYEEMKA